MNENNHCEIQDNLVQMLSEDNNRMRVAGCKLSEAALYVAREHDGVHRLLLAVSEWSKALAGEGGRESRYGNHSNGS